MFNLLMSFLFFSRITDGINEVVITVGLIFTAAATILLLIKKNVESIITYFLSIKLVALLNNAMILINGHAGQLNSSIQSLIKTTEWALDDVAAFGDFVRDYPKPVRPYNESVLTIISAIRLSISDLIDDPNCKISSKGLKLYSEALVTFSQIYRYMPEEHFFMVTSSITTLL